MSADAEGVEREGVGDGDNSNTANIKSKNGPWFHRTAGDTSTWRLLAF